MTDGSQPTRLFDPRVRAAAVAILTLTGLSAFEGLAVIAALPEIASALGNVSLLPWVVTAYMVSSGVATVAAGTLVDQRGVTAIFRWAVGIFLVGSVICGLAPDMWTLVVGRVVQGVGGGAIAAVGLAGVGLVFPRRLVGRAFAANANVWGVMSVAGPAVAALMLGVASWRWIFLINVPLGIGAMALGWNALPGRRNDAEPPRNPPLVDLALLTAFSFGVLFTVDAMSWRALPGAAGTATLGWVLTRRGRDRLDALIRTRHAIDAPLGVLAWSMAALLVGGIGAQTFVPLFVSGGLGVSPTLTAWTILFFVLGWTSGANVSSRLMDRGWATERIVTRGALLVPAALFALASLVWVDAWLPSVFACLYLAGLGTGAATNAAITLVREYARDDEIGRATAAHHFVRVLGFAVGNALVGAILLFVVAAQTGDVEQIRSAIGGHGSGADGSFDGSVRQAITEGFALGVLCAGIVAAAGALLVRRLRAAAPDD